MKLKDYLQTNFYEINNRLNGERGGYTDNVRVKPWSKRIEPALYLLREQINYKNDPSGRRDVVRLQEVTDVPQMSAFDQGIRYFYIAYVYGTGNEQTKRTTEDKFVHSIAYAAYDDTETAEAKAREYLESNLEGKTEVVMGMKKTI